MQGSIGLRLRNCAALRPHNRHTGEVALGLEQDVMEALATSACTKLGVVELNGEGRNPLTTQALINRCVS